MRHTQHRMQPTVLVVEDEPDIVALLRDFLGVAGFDVLTAGDAAAALEAMGDRQVDCVLLDVMLPGSSGFELCRRIREHSDVPLLFLSARSDDSDKLRGLGLGADDYIVKSATPAEVVARVKAVLRRAPVNGNNGGARETLRFGELAIDLGAHEVALGERPVRLTAREFELLRVFAEHPRQVLGRDQLFELLWGSWGDRSAVSVYVRKLREKLEADPAHPRLLVTIWGVGYRFDPPPARR
jgi:DNA-binding response OmpR family regulator